MKKMTCILGLLIGFSLSAQVTIIVEEIPKETPKNASIFISGDFEGWSGGKIEYQLEQKDFVYAITLPKIAEQIQFKFNQGSWESVECDKNGLSIDNRSYVYNQSKDTLKVKIAEDVKKVQGLLAPMIFLIMIPYLFSMFLDLPNASLPIKLLVYVIPFSHTFLAAPNLFLQNYSNIIFGAIYQFAVFMILAVIATKIFSSDKILTLKLNFSKKK